MLDCKFTMLCYKLKIEKTVNVDIGQTTYLPLLTFVDIWTTTYLPHLVNVVCERPPMSTSTISTHLPDHHSIWVFIYILSTSPLIEKFLYYENILVKLQKKYFCVFIKAVASLLSLSCLLNMAISP